jgi:hypothetical protein
MALRVDDGDRLQVVRGEQPRQLLLVHVGARVSGPDMMSRTVRPPARRTVAQRHHPDDRSESFTYT